MQVYSYLDYSHVICEYLADTKHYLLQQRKIMIFCQFNAFTSREYRAILPQATELDDCLHRYSWFPAFETSVDLSRTKSLWTGLHLEENGLPFGYDYNQTRL